MARLLLNGDAQTLEIAHKTWGDLLAWADRTSADLGLLVTAVRLDGVDEPSFRETAMASRPLDGVDVIEVDAANPASLVAESLDDALSGLEGLRAHATDVARRFRGNRLAQANLGLAELTQGLGTLVTLAEAVSSAMGIPIDTVVLDGRPAFSVIEDLGQPLTELTEAQQQQDWVTVADILEFDLEPAISRVAPLFSALASVAHQAQPLSTH
jgi:hypothetical protein